jgi:hypothetical protein
MLPDHPALPVVIGPAIMAASHNLALPSWQLSDEGACQRERVIGPCRVWSYRTAVGSLPASVSLSDPFRYFHPRHVR